MESEPGAESFLDIMISLSSCNRKGESRECTEGGVSVLNSLLFRERVWRRYRICEGVHCLVGRIWRFSRGNIFYDPSHFPDL